MGNYATVRDYKNHIVCWNIDGIEGHPVKQNLRKKDNIGWYHSSMNWERAKIRSWQYWIITEYRTNYQT